MKNSLQQFGTPVPKPFKGATADSGSTGMPESYAKACQIIHIWVDCALGDSCRLHDLLSDFVYLCSSTLVDQEMQSSSCMPYFSSMMSLMVLKDNGPRSSEQFGAKYMEQMEAK
jgi:hypothetical protein